MARGIWKGEINFGLVSIPVTLFSAEAKKELKFSLLDKRDLSHIGYERINKTTGKEVPWENIVEGYEYDHGHYVVLTKEELKHAHPKATQSIDIIEFIDEAEIDPTLYDKPYFLEPTKKGQKSYALLRTALNETGKIGIAKVVIHTRQYLAAMMVRGKAIVLELLRFANELKDPNELNLPDEDTVALNITEREIKMAKQLINSLTESWDPNKYQDDYQEDLLAYLMEKVKLGHSADVQEQEMPTTDDEAQSAEVIDLMALLKKSIAKPMPNKKTSKTTHKKKAGA